MKQKAYKRPTITFLLLLSKNSNGTTVDVYNTTKRCSLQLMMDFRERDFKQAMHAATGPA